jgi:ribosome-binding factor A
MKNMGDGRRQARVEMEVQRMVAQYLITHLKGEIDCIVTVNSVKMPADLRTANVYISVLNYDGKVSKLVKELQSWASEIQRYLGANLKMRYCPKLTFFEDEMTQKVLKIEEILKDITVKPNDPKSGKE